MISSHGSTQNWRIRKKGPYLRDTLVLHLWRVLEPAVSDGAENLGLQQEIPKQTLKIYFKHFGMDF